MAPMERFQNVTAEKQAAILDAAAAEIATHGLSGASINRGSPDEQIVLPPLLRRQVRSLCRRDATGAWRPGCRHGARRTAGYKLGILRDVGGRV